LFFDDCVSCFKIKREWIFKEGMTIEDPKTNILPDSSKSVEEIKTQCENLGFHAFFTLPSGKV